jgi:hypothetical protein
VKVKSSTEVLNLLSDNVNTRRTLGTKCDLFTLWVNLNLIEVKRRVFASISLHGFCYIKDTVWVYFPVFTEVSTKSTIYNENYNIVINCIINVRV